MIKSVKTILFIALASILLLSVIGCAPNSTTVSDEANVIPDMAGRSVTIPSTVNKIFCADPMSAITVYTLAPHKLLGWCYRLNDYETDYILEEYRDLPVYGMKDNINYEAVITADPDIAVLSGTINDAMIEKADKMQEKLGIPVIVLNIELATVPEAYLLLGKATGDTKQASALAAYAQNTLDAVVDIPENQRISIYYANGIDSLNTSAKGSAASQIFDLVQAENVCDMESETGDRMQVTKEHVIDWNPTYIFVNGEPQENLTGSAAAEDILNDTQYANIEAIKNGNVISIPKSPFAWLDRPRSVNRLIGIHWLGSLLYPDHYTFSDKDIKEFYSLFYHLDLTDNQLQQLLNQ